MNDLKKKQEYLKSYTGMKLAISCIEAELKELYEISKSIKDMEYCKVKNLVTQIVELENKKIEETDNLLKKRKEIEEKIKKVKDENCQLLLKYRYLMNLTWEDVAEKMFFCYQYVFILHKKALGMINIDE